MVDVNNFKRDVQRSEGGEWVGELPAMGSLRLKVRGIGSKLYTAKQARLARAVPKSDRDSRGNVNPEMARRILGEAMHTTILLDWDGITDGGKPIKYSDELAMKWLTDPEFSPFLEAVTYAAQVVENGNSDVTAAAVKNS